jgi:putative intracellular protease/amidase
LVPGGIGTRALVHDAAILEWIRAAHETSQFTACVPAPCCWQQPASWMG